MLLLFGTSASKHNWFDISSCHIRQVAETPFKGFFDADRKFKAHQELAESDLHGRACRAWEHEYQRQHVRENRIKDDPLIRFCPDLLRCCSLAKMLQQNVVLA
jgi:hypothetical protein